MTTTPDTSDHKPEPWYWGADTEHCPHGPEPTDDMSPAWDEWSDRHQWSPQDVQICLDAPMGDHCPECSAENGDPVPWSDCPKNPAVVPYCTGDRCADCTADEECCEATCGCCPRVDEHGHCWLSEGSDDDSKRCSQHGEGSLLPRSPKAQAMYDLLRRA